MCYTKSNFQVIQKLDWSGKHSMKSYPKGQKCCQKCNYIDFT